MTNNIAEQIYNETREAIVSSAHESCETPNFLRTQSCTKMYLSLHDLLDCESFGVW